jgi:hypothetical protein
MNRVRVLAALNRGMLEAFSGRTTEALRAALPLRIALPHLEPFLAQNVAKEVRKDALAIRRAGEALVAGRAPGPDAAWGLLEATRDIDREFLDCIGAFAIRIQIPYERIAPLRTKRIAILLEAAYRILDAWGRGRRLRDAFTRNEFEQRLREVLRLYAEETQALSHVVCLPRLLAPLRDRIAQRLYAVMSEVGAQLARDCARSVYRAPIRAGAVRVGGAA